MSGPPSWIVPTVTLFGTVVVSAANYAVQRWRYSSDSLAASVKHFCDEVNSAADLATTYWLLDLTQRANEGDASKLEPSLIGRQLRLQELLLTLGDGTGFDLTAVQKEIPDLFDAMTGGAFQTQHHAADSERALRVQAVAAKINGLARQSLRRRDRRWRP